MSGSSVYKSSVDFKTAPVDYRFSTAVDKTKQCWSLYNEYLRCGAKMGVENPKCQQFYKFAKELCLADQLKSFYEARRDDLWYGYKLPIQPSELQDGDEAVKPDQEEHHAYTWNQRHPGHEYGKEKHH